MDHPAAEVSLSVADVEGLLARQHPHLRGRLRKVAHGWDNDVFRLDDTLAVRLPRREVAAQLIRHEQAWLPLLAERLPVAVPVPVAVGIPDATYPWHWSIVPWFEGASALQLQPEQRDEFAEALADALRALHVPAPADAPHNPVRGVPLLERDDAVRARLHRIPQLEAEWNAAVAAPNWEEAPVWVHGDVHAGNLITRGGALAALIDFGDLCAGDPACDLAIAWKAFTSEGRRRFRERLGDGYDDAVWQRARGWAVSYATLQHDAADPGHRALSAHTVRQLTG